ncbi:MAG: translocation/assembly module TamB domain-containing protein [Bacteroidota bacterium]
MTLVHLSGKIARYTLITVSAFFLLSLLLVFLISLPPIQSRAVVWAKGLLEKEFETEILLESVDFDLPAKAVLNEVTIYDQQNLEMISVEKLRIDLLTFSLWRFLFQRESVQQLKLGQIELIRPDVHLYQSDIDSKLNLQFLLGEKKKKKKNPLKLELSLPNVIIKEGKFTFAKQNSPEGFCEYEKRINFQNLRLDDLNAELAFMLLGNGRTELLVRSLGVKEEISGFHLKHLGVKLSADTLRDSGTQSPQPYVSFENLSIEAQGTRLKGELFFSNETLGLLVDTTLDENFSLRLEQGSLVDIQSINYFIPTELPMQGVVQAEGTLSGTFDEIRSRELKLGYETNTRLRTSVHLNHMKSAKDLVMRFYFQESQVDIAEVQAFLPKVTFPDPLKNMGPMGISGLFQGHYFDFITDAEITSSAGSLTTNLHMVLPPYANLLSYEADIITQNLNLDQLGLTGTPISNRLNFDGRIIGKGTNLSELTALFRANLSNSNFKGYKIDSLVTNLQVADRKLLGKVDMADKEGQLDLDLNLDLNDTLPTYKATGTIDQIDIQHYKLYNEPLLVSSVVDIDLSGDSLDNISGTALLENTRLERTDGDSTPYVIPQFNLTADNSLHQKDIQLSSSLFNFALTGNFTFAEASRFTNELIKETELYLTNNDSLTAAYYQRKRDSTTLPENVQFNFLAQAQDSINEVFRYLRAPVHLAPGSSVIGEMRFSEIEDAKIGIKLDSAAYKGLRLKDLEATLDLIKEAQTEYTLVLGSVRTHHLYPTPNLLLENVNAGLDLTEDVLEFDVIADQRDSTNQFRLAGNATFESGGKIPTQLDANSSFMKLEDYLWHVNPDHLVTFQDGNIKVDHLKLLLGEQFVEADGMLSKSQEDELTITLSEIDLNLVNELFVPPFDLGGTVDLDLVLNQVLAEPLVQATGRAKNFSVDAYEYGNILMNSSWDQVNDRLLIDARMMRADLPRLHLKGYYQLKSDQPLHFNLNTDNPFPLSYISPFVKGQLYGINGSVSLDSLSLTGNFNDLIVNGRGKLQDARFGIDYFKTSYTFNGDIEFEKNRISIERMTLYDELAGKSPKKGAGHQADFYGTIYHEGFRKFEFDLQMDQVQNFLIMNTRKKDNELFYGKIFLENGLASITGDLEKLDIRAFMVSGKGSHLRIPLSDEESLERPDFIIFKEELADTVRKVNTGLQGFELNLTVQATSDAQVDLIFDEKTGDIIQGRGEGTITAIINEQGEFSMFGQYEITSGDYLFTAQNVVNKKFNVKQGGKITWTGDPYQAQVKLKAVYPLQANIEDLLGLEEPVRAPVNVLMEMEGSLLQPEINLEIEVKSLENQSAIMIANALESIENDEQELNKQVFSLMVFNRFAPTNTATAGGNENFAGSGVTTSISELLSNQLNYLLSQIITDKVNVDFATSNFQDVNLLVSAKLFNDRVTIERDGTLVAANSNFSLGNISVIIKLLPPPGQEEGQVLNRSELVLEVFTRENLNFTGGTAYSNQAGFGVFYKKDFNSLREMFKRREPKK